MVIPDAKLKTERNLLQIPKRRPDTTLSGRLSTGQSVVPAQSLAYAF